MINYSRNLHKKLFIYDYSIIISMLLRDWELIIILYIIPDGLYLIFYWLYFIIIHVIITLPFLLAVMLIIKTSWNWNHELSIIYYVSFFYHYHINIITFLDIDIIIFSISFLYCINLLWIFHYFHSLFKVYWLML